ncbi:hypothetical protein K501DRAFT_246609 [Backusella circina FSU 941]|nr:hypothetical protein K501DRAFT_246609 [Backusella circina FSU 941]
MSELTDYEKKRLENIELNQKLLAELDVPSAKTAVTTSILVKEQPKRRRVTSDKPRKKKAEPLPIRKSSRLRGEKALDIEINDENNMLVLQETLDPRLEELMDENRLLTYDEYFSDEIKKNAIIVDGHYRDWVNPTIMHKHGIEASADEAWEKNGGGTFSFRDTTGSGIKRKKGSVSNAKADALKMFKKNPNQYFYRHNEPGEEQWVTDWSQDERELFLKVARDHGCGDKWGLFASYIPHRVGYQCSNFYRHDIIKNGLISDPNYQFTPSGIPVYTGSYNNRRS